MERYDHISVVGEGSYGVVLKCRHRDSDQVVAIKKFLETEEDAGARRMALREIRMLKKLKHENLITMIEVFRHRKRFYLVFEYLQGTLLDEIEKHSGGIGEEKSREHIYQVLRAVAYCHAHHVVHRDIKPENILISAMGVIKLCDFGFARVMSPNMELCTEYVATRWYRAPELLVGEQRYGAPVDIWAVGCLFAEMLTGEPLFPGESDIDQLHLIVKTVGKPCAKHQALMSKNSQLRGMVRSTTVAERGRLQKLFANWSVIGVDFMINCLRMDPQARLTSADLMKHAFFIHDNFPQVFLPDLRDKVNIEFNANPLMRKFKAEILISTDTGKLGDDKSRKVSQTPSDNSRWKMNVVEGSGKRKFSCDNSESTLQGRKSYREKTGMTFLKSNKLSLVNDNDINSLGQAFENMTALSDYIDSSTITSFSFSCNRKGGKKSPTLLQSIQPSIVKAVTSSNLAAVKSITQSIKKDHKNLENDQFINIEPVHFGYVGQSNKSTNTIRKGKLKNDFTLPNLPGATTSPKDSKSSKNAGSPESTSFITPRILSANGSPKYILPFM